MLNSSQKMPNFQKDIMGATVLSARNPVSVVDVKQTTYNSEIMATNNECKKWEFLMGKNTNVGETKAMSGGIDLYSYDKDIYSYSTPMPLPSPHIVLQSSTTVKPSVPELSMIMGENLSVLPQEIVEMEFIPEMTKSLSIDTTLKSIENFTPVSQICYHADDIRADAKLQHVSNEPGCQILKERDVQLKHLQSQVTNLLATHETNLENEEVEAFGNNKGVDVSDTTQSYPAVLQSKSSYNTSMTSQTLADSAMFETKDSKQLERSNDMRPPDKFPLSEFASIHLDETNLREILTANNENEIGSHNHSTPINIDLPVLETSTDRSASITFDRTAQGRNLWDAQDSPILGESASLCVVAPVDFPKHPTNTEKSVNNERHSFEKVEDKQFMKTILDQVTGMLRKPNGNDGSTDVMNGGSWSKSKVKVDRKTCHHKIAKATRRRLCRKGSRVEENNLIDDDQAKQMHDYTGTHPKSPLRCLTRSSSILGGSTRENGSANTLFTTPSTTEMSINVSAIAQKYLSNEQLEEITALCRQDSKLSTIYSGMTTDILGNTTCSALMLHARNCDDSKTLDESNMPGASLISPSNMSLATRKYMEKYRLIEKSTTNGKGSVKDESFEEFCAFHDSSSLVRTKLTLPDADDYKSNSHQRNSKGEQERISDYAGQLHMQEIQLNNRKETELDQRFSHLRGELGDTLDMILPFLDDLDKHRQQTPSSDGNQEYQNLVSGCLINEGNSETWTLEGKSTSKCFTGDIGNLATTQEQGGNEDASQVLSPEILQTVLRSKKNACQVRGSERRVST